MCCFEEILNVASHKTAAVRSLTSSHVDSYTWTHQRGQISKDLYSSALCGHRFYLEDDRWSEWRVKGICARLDDDDVLEINNASEITIWIMIDIKCLIVYRSNKWFDVFTAEGFSTNTWLAKLFFITYIYIYIYIYIKATRVHLSVEITEDSDV